ncbi:MAG: hypothetical protein HY000_01205 [Planctomycetes bacterium]|nr:hypothetical protein [Planctomycetota bacterium]
MGLGKYLKTAFANRWNLLTFGGGMAFALLTPWPDVIAPLVLACEVTYLGLLGTHPKFQAYVDAQEHKAARAQVADTSEASLRQILKSLPRQSIQKFDALKARCLELRRIAAALKDPADIHQPLDSMQVSGLDRLLWIYLRLLFTEYSLESFLEKTDERRIQSDVRRLEEQLQGAAAGEDAARLDRIRRTLEDNLQTSRDRLANLRKARDNLELVQLEINRLENKIQSLSELAVNRQDPDFISGQVDQVASSMLQTERTMNELRFATGLSEVDEAVPELLNRQVVQTKR